MASEQKILESCLEHRAYFIKTKAVEALIGNELFFRRLSAYAHQRNAKYTNDLYMSSMRNKLDKLWQEKDFLEIVKLLTPVKEQLTPTEIKKLEYARKRC